MNWFKSNYSYLPSILLSVLVGIIVNNKNNVKSAAKSVNDRDPAIYYPMWCMSLVGRSEVYWAEPYWL